jgi:hypothetical protein
MAKPAFIYSFDNLGPYRFTELCGELLGQRYNGFLLGGEGTDGGIDAEIDKTLGILHPQSHTPLLNEIIQPGQIIVFQFKHKVTARVGQSQSREQLLSLYKCNKGKSCELHKDLVNSKKPNSYVLVTNVEVNSLYRERFIKQCKEENESIINYQIIGLDELVNWIETMPELRHMYFPTIFGLPRFNLRITINYAYPIHLSNPINGELLAVNVLNVGTVLSYLGSAPIKFVFLIDGKEKLFTMYNFQNPELLALNPQAKALEPGKKYTYHFETNFTEIKKFGKDIFPIEIRVEDEIGNIYTLQLDERTIDVQKKIRGTVELNETLK